MQPPDKHTLSRHLQALSQFPKGHLAAAGALIFALGVWAGGSFNADTTNKQQAKNTRVALTLPALNDAAAQSSSELESHTLTPSAAPTLEAQHETEASASFTPVSEPVLNKKAFTVRSGDSLSTLFKRAGLNDTNVYELTSTCEEAKGLTRIMPGHEIVFYLDDAGTLQKLSHITNRLTSTHFERAEQGFVSAQEIKKPDVLTAYKEATINSSLFLAGQAVGMHDALIMELANIFGWDVDFALDIRKGDSFNVLYEEKFLDGEKIGTGAILAAEFTNQGHKFQAVRYTNAAGDSHYYTPDGESMRKAFLLAPLDFRRISGNFNPRRLHPIFKTVRPHRGTDYAASTGTPVWAAGDGRVVAAGYTKPNGNYVFIQHGNNIQTKYLHLNKKSVKTGQRVKQRQIIGTVGSTGYATGPHLHYEFLLDGVHRNPRTIVQKLPKAASVPKTEMAQFRAQTEPVVAQLQQRYDANRLALGSSERSIN
ncbi:peptidoglycan DD-metalloendopeptidase family protein [Gilvimarinus polysaccharolyticus]|uniref:peptidoglycan DD-metalloendopeptidase family protein n=1 Tax=Gilvimarinus polysaccharolyticus TaxID=863921 RepID=UPI0006734586|nr:peptidoglycan DD-metalloendopeptidase family protein [Gilvimarinus polysaccharolyticus]